MKKETYLLLKSWLAEDIVKMIDVYIGMSKKPFNDMLDGFIEEALVIALPPGVNPKIIDKKYFKKELKGVARSVYGSTFKEFIEIHKKTLIEDEDSFSLYMKMLECFVQTFYPDPKDHHDKGLWDDICMCNAPIKSIHNYLTILGRREGYMTQEDSIYDFFQKYLQEHS